jgi:hypothetical protein
MDFGLFLGRDGLRAVRRIFRMEGWKDGRMEGWKDGIPQQSSGPSPEDARLTIKTGEGESQEPCPRIAIHYFSTNRI